MGIEMMADTTMTRCCAHCRFMGASKGADLEYARCEHPNNVIVVPDYVRGGSRRQVIFRYADSMRRSIDPGHCGPEGKWFEAKNDY